MAKQQETAKRNTAKKTKKTFILVLDNGDEI